MRKSEECPLQRVYLFGKYSLSSAVIIQDCMTIIYILRAELNSVFISILRKKIYIIMVCKLGAFHVVKQLNNNRNAAI